MSLDVYLHGRRIGSLTKLSGTDYSFAYLPEIMADAGEGAVVLSEAMPVQADAYDAMATRTFFEGLLPEDARRDEIARELRVSPNDSYALLERIGRDCAGAVVVVPAGTVIGSEAAIKWLTDEELRTMVEELPRRPLGVSSPGDVRLSLAGVQRKLTLIRSPYGQFGKPEADAPSTHLIKPQYSDEYPDLAFNEAFCMRVVKCVGLPAAETELHTIADRACLISQRFDRSTDGAATTRLHQEDLCQALGTSSNLKYQQHSGPGFLLIRQLLQEIGRGADVEVLARVAVCNYVLGNSDAHGKNFAILFADLGRRLAPLYDVVCTAVYDLETNMAMSIGAEYDPAAVDMADWLDLAADLDLPPAAFLGLVRETAAKTEECARTVADLARAERWHAPIIDRIVGLVERRATQINAVLAD